MISWLLSFLSSDQAKAIAALFGALGTLFGGIAAVFAIFERKERKMLDERLKDAELQITAKEQEITRKQQELDIRANLIADRQMEIDNNFGKYTIQSLSQAFTTAFRNENLSF